ncbi:MAG: hypothetical protein ACM3KM_02735 [Acidobacteriaceae bacterium]
MVSGTASGLETHELWLDKEISLEEFRTSFFARFPTGVIDGILERMSPDKNLISLSVSSSQKFELQDFYVDFSNTHQLSLTMGPSSFAGNR